MFSKLSGILALLRVVRDGIVERGPMTLRGAADLLAKLENAARDAADFIEVHGPDVMFAPGSAQSQQAGLDSEEAKRAIQELKTISAECQNAVVLSQHGKQGVPGMPANPQNGLKDLFNRLSPETKKFIAGLVTQIITSVLTKVGAA